MQGPASALPIDGLTRTDPSATPVDTVDGSSILEPSTPAELRLPDGSADAPPAAPGAVTIADGGDGFLNAAEVPAVFVTGTYDAGDPLLTTVTVRIVASAICNPSASSTSPLDATLAPNGTWTAGPFDVSGPVFPEGAAACARAFSRNVNNETNAGVSSNTSVKDTIGPVTGSVAYVGGYSSDGFINAAEAAEADPAGRPVSWVAGDGSASAAEGRFTDAADAIPGGSCGVFALGASGGGYLNLGCIASASDGELRWQARWQDAAGNWSLWASTSITIDRIAPIASIDLLDADGKVSSPEAAGGVPVSWSVSETGPNVAISAANTGEATPAQCSWPNEARAATGGITATCFASLLDGPIEVTVAGADAAGNPAIATDASLLDRLAGAPVVTFDTDPINAANVGAVGVTLDGETGAQVDVTIEDEDGNQLTDSTTLASPVTLSFDLTGLVDGTITATAVLTDGDGNVSAASTDAAVKDTLAPLPGNVAYDGPYALDGYLNIVEAAAPDPSGRPVTWTAGEPGATAAEGRFTDPSNAIILGGNCGIFALGVDGTGYLNSSCMSAVPQGEVRWQVRWRDAAGNWSDWASTSILIDTIAPPVDIDAPIDGDTFEVGATVPVEGVTEANLPLSYDIDGSAAGDGTAAGDGSWNTTVSGLSEGVHTFTASATDIAGNVGTGSVDIDFDANIPFIITPVQNAFVSKLVTIGGTSPVGSMVEVFEGGSLIGTTDADGSGKWALVTGLTEGVHSIRARGTDLDGNVSLFSSVRTFTVDAGRPTLTIDQSDPAIFPMGTALSGGAGDDDGVARIEIGYFNALGGKVLTQDATCATCGVGGLSVTWTAEPELLPGLYRIEAVAIDVNGNRSPIRTLRFVTL